MRITALEAYPSHARLCHQLQAYVLCKVRADVATQETTISVITHTHTEPTISGVTIAPLGRPHEWQTTLMADQSYGRTPLRQPPLKADHPYWDTLMLPSKRR